MVEVVAQPVEIKIPAGFKIKELGRSRVAVTVPRGDEGMVSWIKARGAKWDRELRAWTVPGTKRADLAAKLGKMAESEAAAAAAETAEMEAASFAISERAAIIKENRGLRIVGSTLEMAFPYSNGAVAIARKLPGAKWDNERKVWKSTPKSAADVESVIASCRRIADIVEAEVAARLAKREAEDKARQKARADLESRRTLVAVGEAKVGRTMIVRDRLVTVTDLGTSWIVRSEDACMYGMMPEDTQVQYAYYRSATEAETDAYEKHQAATRASVEKLKAKKAANDNASHEIDSRGQYLESSAIDHASIDAGEVLLEEDGHLRPYGGGAMWVVAGDKLWRLQGNGADGDDWSRCNHRGYIAICMHADVAIVAALREAGRP